MPITPPLLSPSSSLPALEGLAPVVTDRIRILIMGSFPGAASLGMQQYYAHPRNQFWCLLSAVLDLDLAELPYPERLQRLLEHDIGLWDVIGACERNGSLDSAIRHARPNDFAFLREHCPLLEKICFNGKTSGRFAPLFSAAGYKTLVLPSSSPAHASLSFAAKLEAWREIIR